MLLQIESETGLIRLTKQSRAWGFNIQAVSLEWRVRGNWMGTVQGLLTYQGFTKTLD